MEKQPPQVTYAGYYHSTPEQSSRLSWHSHKCPELVLITDGCNRTLFPGGIEFQCPKGTLIVTPAEIMHKQIDTPRSEVLYAGFIPGGGEFDASLRILNLAEDPYPEVWLNQIRELFFSGEGLEEANLLMEALLAHLKRREGGIHRKQFRHPAVETAVKYLDGHLTRKLSLRDIARTSGISPSRLNFLFRQELSVSVMQCLTFKRMFLARRLLADPMKTVAEAGGLSGYPDPNYFTRMFRKVHGCTPLHFRKHLPESLAGFSWRG
ncbi:MAG: HTH-type transcriptional activator Btr [Lentisphaerae bacterium ADurb.Bin242]|nr:MAG: HTH-type transcriptional activator Btr [Lentisphaerae bacterium ADurb.Bin242]